MNAGEVIFDARVPGSSRETIALFSQATQDPNPIHIDDVFALRCGFAQVIQQGPMTTAHFARLLAEHVGLGQLRSLDVSFSAPVFPLEDLQLSATVEQVADGLALLALVAKKADGTVTAKGQAQVALYSL
jgi:acyl dehydratase